MEEQNFNWKQQLNKIASVYKPMIEQNPEPKSIREFAFLINDIIERGSLFPRIEMLLNRYIGVLERYAEVIENSSPKSDEYREGLNFISEVFAGIEKLSVL